ncbi:hypothetical protein [Pelolinea submarina]|uniref:Uncharacterized protein n=1 Tax=Pelolinea submarina TaxID=913107 RepID=A0A347ZUP2_9CHLR|nr:hypothetical protein [Pelolinea submarina]REG10391.1 hypothetical protein DFR64_0249 [Pelolinea submarina]BBB49023.1 hypothetical protein Pelsub_P2254 [Pelolinea submarina]
MNPIVKFLRRIFPDIKSTLGSAVIGLSISAAIYLGSLQRHFFSKRYAIYALLIALAATILAAWLRQRWLSHRYHNLPRAIRITVVVFSVILSLVLLANIQIQPVYYLLPDTTMEVRIPIGTIPDGEESVRLLWVETGQGYVYYQNMHFEGQWERVEKNIVFPPNQEVRFTWTGKVGSTPQIAFRMTHYDQPVFISWNGEGKEYNLNQPKEPNILIDSHLDIPLIYKMPFILAFSISAGFVLFALLILLGTWQPAKRQGKAYARGAWLWYMLPMVLLWGFTLLVFWPGIMSGDSITLWNQNLVGEYSDWQSAFYALVLAGLMKIWYSPALITILQILSFSFLVAWGLKALQEEGVSRIILWGISLLFALSPINNLYATTLWRDIPYALAVMWLTVIAVKVYLSQGKWVEGWGWVWLGVSGFFIAILRQNGIPVAFSLLVLLPIFYSKYRKQLSRSLLLCLAFFLLMKGPVYSWLNVDRSKSGQSNLILLHHIAAHLDADTALKADEEEYLNSFLSIPDWKYYCCYVGTISYDNDFERDRFLASSSENRKLALDLFLRDPLVDVQHTVCSGELTWRFNDNQCYMKSTHGFNSWVPGEVSWIVPNDAGLKEDSRFPTLVTPYVDALRIFGFRDDFLVVYLRPALYLYLAMFFIMVEIIRRKDFRVALVVLPLIIQSAILFLVSYAPAIRYQYSNYLVGLYLLGILFLPADDAQKDALNEK